MSTFVLPFVRLCALYFVWLCTMLVIIALRAGALSRMNAGAAVFISVLMFSLIWLLYSYDYVTLMIMRSTLNYA